MCRCPHSRLMFPYNRNDNAPPDMANFFLVLLHPQSPYNPCSTCDKMRQSHLLTEYLSQSGIRSFCCCCWSSSSSLGRRISLILLFLEVVTGFFHRCRFFSLNACRRTILVEFSYFGSRTMGNYRVVCCWIA